MEIEYGIKDFIDLIKKMKYHRTEISFVTNSIRIDFYSENNEHLYFFWIDPPWRITLNDKIIMNSYNYPYHSNYSENQKEQEENDFYEWCNKINVMKNEKVQNIILLDNCDLIIEWENGASLNNFVNDTEAANYWFYDKMNGKAYDFMYKKILQDDFVSKNKKAEKMKITYDQWNGVINNSKDIDIVRFFEIEQLIKRMDQSIYTQVIINQKENYLLIGGGEGKYIVTLVTGNGDDFYTLVNDSENTDDDEIDIVTGGQ